MLRSLGFKDGVEEEDVGRLEKGARKGKPRRLRREINNGQGHDAGVALDWTHCP